VTIPSGVIHDSHIEYLTYEAEYLDYPIDGLVFKYDDVAYGNSLGATEHHFNDAIAYKFYDEEYETELIDIEWTMGRTGILTPVAIVQPVDTGDSIVERASLHNLSIMKSLLGSPRFGQKVKLIKSNMIIPQIIWGEETCGQGNLLPPAKCPICGGDTVINKDNDSEFLFCSNPECSGKLLNKIDHYCGKKGLDIKGLSVSTIAKLMDWGWVNSIKDIYNLHNHREEWIAKPGYGERSVDKILAAIEESKSTTFIKYLSAIGIPLIGTAVAKELNKTFMGWSDFRLAVEESFAFYTLDTFGIEKHRSLLLFDYTEFDEIATMLSFEEDSIAQAANSVSLQGITVVITGKLINYKNRSELQAAIESAGGKVASSVSKNTNYLINNDTTSGSSKNLTAKKLGIEIISEQEFIEKFLTF
jgi:DNA ligase (NAD+)